MSNEQKLREALRIAVNYIDMDALYTFAGSDHDTIKEALATTEPAVNQQLTTEPFDEREAFEREMSCEEIWGHRSLAKKTDGRYGNWCVDLMWAVWQARASIEKSAAKEPALHIGACITDGVLHATVMRREANGHVTILATAEMDAKSLLEHDCVAKLSPAAPSQPAVPLTEEQIGKMYCALESSPAWGALEFYWQGIEDAEKHHGIRAKGQRA